MKLAFIVQRYGTEIIGGSEYLCRLIAERMSERHEVEVLTTCARDYTTWTNEYPEGTDRIRGVTVRRFASDRMRDVASFNRYSDWIFNNPHSREDEYEWLKQQGPWSPRLLEHLERNHAAYDTLIFFTYLYAPTVFGLRIAPERSILIPTAHDEPAIQLEIYKEVFSLPAALSYNTDVERRFVNTCFQLKSPIEDTIGCGVDLPQHQAYAKPRGLEGSDEQDPEAQPTDAQAGGAGEPAAGWRSEVGRRGSAFRRRHKLEAPFALYGGRIDPGKGCEELFEYFSSYIAEGGAGSLVLMGVKLMRLPEAPFIRFAGTLSEHERVQALEAATVVIVPSPYESLSLLALEAFAVGTPILANARSEVLEDHCVRSNAGLYYGNRDEFVEGLKLLVSDERLRAALGRNGRDYIRRNYRWDVILGKYDRMIARIKGEVARPYSPSSASP